MIAERAADLILFGQQEASELYDHLGRQNFVYGLNESDQSDQIDYFHDGMQRSASLNLDLKPGLALIASSNGSQLEFGSNLM